MDRARVGLFSQEPEVSAVVLIALAQHLGEQFLFAIEVVQEAGLAQADGLGDPLDARAVVAFGGNDL